MALSDYDLKDWLGNLAHTNAKRRSIIIDLLRHKAEDQMSDEDVRDCRKALDWLDGGKVDDRPGPRSVPEALIEVEVEH